jgi:hypothetical protein
MLWEKTEDIESTLRAPGMRLPTDGLWEFFCEKTGRKNHFPPPGASPQTLRIRVFGALKEREVRAQMYRDMMYIDIARMLYNATTHGKAEMKPAAVERLHYILGKAYELINPAIQPPKSSEGVQLEEEFEKMREVFGKPLYVRPA